MLLLLFEGADLQSTCLRVCGKALNANFRGLAACRLCMNKCRPVGVPLPSKQNQLYDS